MLRRFTLLAFLSVLLSHTYAQTIRFTMYLMNDSIGEMTVSHTVKPDGSDFYVLETKTKAQVLFVNKVGYTRYEVTYKNGKLISSNHKETENGKTKRWTNVKWNGSVYEVDSYKGKRTFTEAPTYSIVTIYFKDIANVSRIFYEAEGDFSTLTKTNNNTWQFKSSDGNMNIYHFLNGKIQGMEFKVSIATVKAVREI